MIQILSRDMDRKLVREIYRVDMNNSGDFDNNNTQIIANGGWLYVCIPGKGWFKVLMDREIMLEYSDWVRGDPSNSPPDSKNHGVPPLEWYSKVIEAVCKEVYKI